MGGKSIIEPVEIYLPGLPVPDTKYNLVCSFTANSDHIKTGTTSRANFARRSTFSFFRRSSINEHRHLLIYESLNVIVGRSCCQSRWQCYFVLVRTKKI